MAVRDWALAIDFGTSNTAAAHTSPISGAVEALTLSHNRTTMSSSVFVEAPDRIAVGDVATDRAESNPAAFIPAPKRAIGLGVVTVDGYTVPAAVPVAAVLDSVIARARAAHGGTAPSKLVLTHPEAWSRREIQVLLDAAAQLGHDPSQVTTVSEPRAAAHYYTRAHTVTPGTKIAVFDFGGGTLDVAVLEANARGSFDVVAARGDNGLGGKNLDAHMRRWVDQQLDVRDPDLLDFVRTRAALDVRYALEDSIRRAKELLSEAPSATITVTGDGRTERFQITRDEFEELISPVLDKAVELARATLLDARITAPGQLEALYLTGGSSRIPAVHDRLRPLGPIATLDDPKTVVAQGALAAAAPIVRSPQGSIHSPQGSTHSPQGSIHSPQGSTRTPGPQPTWPAPAVPTPPTTAFAEWPSPSTGAPAHPDPATGGHKKLAMAGAAVAVAAIAALAGFFVLDRSSGDSDTPTADGPSSSVAQDVDPAAASGGGNGDTPPTTKEAVVAALPSALRSELSDCKQTGETDNGGAQLQCQIAADSFLTSGIVEENSGASYITVSVDIRDAKKQVLRLRQGNQNDTAAADNQIVENVARTAAAHLSAPEITGAYSIAYANGATGVMVGYYDAVGADGAKTFLSRAGLIN
ncbi:Hsp70 family protein [Rhodococcus sp. BGS-1C]|uniref:Hsp70 family protein n=1 Tax=unclassified Rhodococcus (in: high G+C Gram-positive bacteria) TaxID=192944 RepID=UPI0019CFB8F8|nr:Hsp70 family protein [Rhodococcus sp. KRD197]